MDEKEPATLKERISAALRKATDERREAQTSASKVAQILEHREEIDAYRAAGANLVEVHAVLRRAGLDVNIHTLRKALRGAKAPKRAKSTASGAKRTGRRAASGTNGFTGSTPAKEHAETTGGEPK